jgi:hypothetical protein
MRGRNYTGSLSNAFLDKSQAFILSQVLLYVDMLLTRYGQTDCEILETIHWLLGPAILEEDLLPLAAMLGVGEAFKGPSKHRSCGNNVRNVSSYSSTGRQFWARPCLKPLR